MQCSNSHFPSCYNTTLWCLVPMYVGSHTVSTVRSPIPPASSTFTSLLKPCTSRLRLRPCLIGCSYRRRLSLLSGWDNSHIPPPPSFHGNGRDCEGNIRPSMRDVALQAGEGGIANNLDLRQAGLVPVDPFQDPVPRAHSAANLAHIQSSICRRERRGFRAIGRYPHPTTQFRGQVCAVITRRVQAGKESFD